jgi:hypothetical protein
MRFRVDGGGELKVDVPSGAQDMAAFLADMVSPGGMHIPAQPDHGPINTAEDVTRERLETLIDKAGNLSIVGVARS